MFALVFGLFAAGCRPNSPAQQSLPIDSAVQQTAQVVLHFGDAIATHTATLEPELSALSALMQVASSSGRQVEVKSYSFGTLIESIDGYANSTDKAWIYFVNNTPASVGADGYLVKPNDLIEWRYTKPE
jgi:hypothetical protein